MTHFFIDPKAPLIFGDGRPFAGTERGDTLPFPLPSTLAGALRTAYGEQRNHDFAHTYKALLNLTVAGPLLVARSLGDNCNTVYFPKPADAVYFRQQESTEAIRLRPVVLPSDQGGTDLPSGLLPVFLSQDTKSKPDKGAAYWTLAHLTDWLTDDGPDVIAAQDLGVSPLPQDHRTHVAVDAEKLTSEDGLLFQTTGLDFGPRRWPRPSPSPSPAATRPYGWQQQSFGLLVNCPDAADEPFLSATPRLRTIGGERRPAWIEPADGLWPEIPATLDQALTNLSGTGGIRLMLVTPALFKHGWLPDWLDESLQGSPPGHPDITLQLCAAVLDRWQAFSGWDLQADRRHEKESVRPARHKGGVPREVRRLVAAGSVYWFRLVNGNSATLSQLWLSSISDHEQDRRDGFGLAVPGLWTWPS